MSFGFERVWLLALGAAALIVWRMAARLSGEVPVLDWPLGPPGGTAYRPPFRLEILMRLLRALEAAGVFLLFAAAAGPRFVIARQVWLDRGADIFFVLDVSPSMAALDMDGRSRFDAARELCAEFARENPQDAVGLAVTGTEAALLLPPTVDRNLFYARLEALKVGEMGDGTALGLGLAVAALHLRNSAAPRRACVLVTDGENNAGPVHPETAAAALRENGARLWVIGVGSGGEVPIDYTDPVSGVRRRGIFESRFNPDSLRTIARLGGGAYLGAPSAAAFREAFDRVGEAELTVSRSGTVYSERSLEFAALAAALICIFAARLVKKYGLGALF